MHGVVVAFAVTEGDTVTAGSPIAVLEAMKMEITALTHAIGEVVDTGAVLAKIETSQGEDSWRTSSR
ncbi:acetyl-CoA carboxylase biotin carboxyl carrier protein subunit [Actinophytocola sp.]|uniref:acetyl-CoA carboxylase biotin carboxyl carrier protein subunit n=1 Tax=Actinophytocola sp. TaxID=1872138 RepID=UPI003D6AA00D